MPNIFMQESTKHGGPGPGVSVHVPLHSRRSKQRTVRVTEGELKADIATARTGILTLGLPGVGMFARAVPILQELGAEKVIIAFDADYRHKPAVAAALRAYHAIRRVVRGGRRALA